MHNLEAGQNRVDKLDGKLDKKVSLVAGKTDQLTGTYLKKTSKVVEAITALDAADGLKQEAKAAIAAKLKQVDATNLETSEAAFKKSVDGLLDKIGERIQAKKIIEGLSFSMGGPNSSTFQALYKRGIAGGAEINLARAQKLKSYVETSDRFLSSYQDSLIYFQGESASYTNNEVARTFVGPEILGGILFGEGVNVNGLLSGFEKISSELAEKKMRCEKFENTMSSKFGASFSEATDHETVVGIFSGIIDAGVANEEEIVRAVSKLVEVPEFDREKKALNGPADVEALVLEAHQAGDVNVLRARLMAKQIFDQQLAEQQAKIEEAFQNAQTAAANIDSYRTEYRASDGTFYGAMMIGRAVVSTNGNNRGDFKQYYGLEAELAAAKVRLQEASMLQAKIRYQRDDVLKQTNALAGNKKSTERIVQIADEVIHGNFDESRLVSERAEYDLAKLEAEEKATVLASSNLLKGELMYRQSLEGGEMVENEVVQNAVAARKETKMKALQEAFNSLQPSIRSSYQEVDLIIAGYKNLAKVPLTKQADVITKIQNFRSRAAQATKYAANIRGLNMELGVVKESAKIDLSALDQQEKFVKDGLARANEFIGAETEEESVITPELEALAFGKLREQVGSNFESIDQDVKTNGASVKFFFEEQMGSSLVRTLESGMLGVLNKGLSKLSLLSSVIHRGRDVLYGTRNLLMKQLDAKSPLFDQYPELEKMNRRLCAKLIHQIDQKLAGPFSLAQVWQVDSLKKKLETAKEDMFWDVVKNAAVFVTTVVAAMATGGAAGVIGGRIATAFGMSMKGHKIVSFASSSVGMSAASTIAPRVTMTLSDALPGSKWSQRVDWSAGAMAGDFTKSLLLASGLYGAGRLIGDKLAINTMIRSGGDISHAELMKYGISKLSFVHKLLNPLEAQNIKQVQGAVNKMRQAGFETMAEITQEIIDDFAENIDPNVALLVGLLQSSKSRSVDVNLGAKIDIQNVLANAGARFNETIGRTEFTQDSVVDFANDLKSQLGDLADKVKVRKTWNGSALVTIEGTDISFKVHPQKIGGLETSVASVMNSDVDLDGSVDASTSSVKIPDYSDLNTFEAKKAQLDEMFETGKLDKAEHEKHLKKLEKRARQDLMMHVMDKAEEFVEANKSASEAEIVAHLEDFAKSHGLPMNRIQKGLVKRAVKQYVKERGEFQAGLTRFTVNGEFSKRMFLDAIGLDTVKADAVIIDTSMSDTLAVKFLNHADAEVLRTSIDPNDPRSFGGFYTRHNFPGAPNLSGKIVVVSMTNSANPDATLAHEVQHRRFSSYFGKNSEATKLMIFGQDGKQNLPEKLGYDFYENYMMDETLAYFRGGKFQYRESSLMGQDIADTDLPAGEKIKLRAAYDSLCAELNRLKGRVAPRDLYQVAKASRSFPEMLERLAGIELDSDTQLASEVEARVARLSEAELKAYEMAGMMDEVDASGIETSNTRRLDFISMMRVDVDENMPRFHRLAREMERQYPDNLDWVRAHIGDIEARAYDVRTGKPMSWERKVQLLQAWAAYPASIAKLNSLDANIASSVDAMDLDYEAKSALVDVHLDAVILKKRLAKSDPELASELQANIANNFHDPVALRNILGDQLMFASAKILRLFRKLEKVAPHEAESVRQIYDLSTVLKDPDTFAKHYGADYEKWIPFLQKKISEAG